MTGTVSPRLGLVAAPLHRAPAAAAGGGAIIEARRARSPTRRCASARPRRGCPACAPRRARRRPAPGGDRRAAPRRAAGPADSGQARPRRGQPAVDARERGGVGGPPVDRRRQAVVDRLAQRACLDQQRRGHGGRCRVEQAGAGSHSAEVDRRDERLDPTAPALPEGVDEVGRRPAPSQYQCSAPLASGSSSTSGRSAITPMYPLNRLRTSRE